MANLHLVKLNRQGRLFEAIAIGFKTITIEEKKLNSTPLEQKTGGVVSAEVN